MKTYLNILNSVTGKMMALCGMILVLSTLTPAAANNIAVSSAVLTGQNTSGGANNVANYCLVRFNLSWDNSWRSSSGPSNWDAAYVFVKYRVGSSDYTLTGASSSGTTITVSSTSDLRAGMVVEKVSGTGSLVDGTVITAINSATTFTVNQAPSSALSSASIYVYRQWYHAYLNNSGHSAGTGTAASVQSALVDEGTAFNSTTNPAVGAFIYRSSTGSGTFSVSNAQLRWNYGANGILDNDIVDIKVFAIEMVYVPQASFYLGDGNTSLPRGRFSKADSTTVPFLVTSENAITLGGTTAGNLGNNNTSGQGNLDDFNNTTTKTLPAAFPKGYNAFYCMKYPITGFQLSEFINTLNRMQQNNLFTSIPAIGSTGYPGGALFISGGSTSPQNRNTLCYIGPALSYGRVTIGCNGDVDNTLNESTDGLGVPVSDLISGIKLLAFQDWAGLRPISEMEFEKMCRGTVYPVQQEYAWGTSSGTSNSSITNSYARNETPNTGNYSNSHIRVGSFATTNNVSRVNAGASYYGVMNLHDNNDYFHAIHVGISAARSFTGTLHGNGTLTSNGYADISTWPGYTGGANSTSNATWGSKAIHAATQYVSDRTYAGSTSGLSSCSGYSARLAPSSAAE